MVNKMNEAMSLNPNVSLIVPVYGVEKYIEKCLDSLVSQSFKSIEIILVDDGSKDKSGEICERYSKAYPSLITLIQQENTGLGGARNTGIKAARGKYLMFVDSDDYLRSDAVECAYNTIKGDDADIAVFGIHFVSEKGRNIKSVYDNSGLGVRLNARVNKDLLLGSPSAWNKIYKTDLFRKNNIWFPPRAWHEDVRTTLKILTVADSISYINDYLYYYVQRNGSITHNVDVERNSEIIDAIDDVLKYYKDNGIFDIFHDELEFITIINMYNAASARVAANDTRNHLLQKYRDYLYVNFPNYKSNKYIKTFSARQCILFHLVERKAYRLLKYLDKVRYMMDSRG